LQRVWLTPLRALAADTGLALREAAHVLRPYWTVAVCTGDTTTAARAQQVNAHPPRSSRRPSGPRDRACTFDARLHQRPFEHGNLVPGDPRGSDAFKPARISVSTFATSPARPRPFAFPLLVEMFRAELSTEALEARVARRVEALEADATLAGTA